MGKKGLQVKERRSIVDKFLESQRGPKNVKRTVKPWDLLNSDRPRATDEVAQDRYEMCKACPELTPITHQCKKCFCFMNLKVKLAEAECPIGKWTQTQEIE